MVINMNEARLSRVAGRLGDIHNFSYRCMRYFQSILRLEVLLMDVATVAEGKVSLEATEV
jgi:hypothetical protein